MWGENQPHRTTTESLGSYIKGIPLGYIPKTIIDAITVTHKLGLRYLWVDSFCILQDSKEDKAREIAQMRHIFHDSYVTIIAACARRVSDGFLHDRRETVRMSVRDESLLPFRCPDGSIGTVHAVQMGPLPTYREPVETRAWCLEEDILSRRKLIYAMHTLLYECQTIRRDNVDGVPSFIKPYYASSISRLPSGISSATMGCHPSADDIGNSWYQILGLYSERTLTKPQDKLIALAGVAETFSQFWPDSKYLAGLWSHQLPGSLLWKSYGIRRHCNRHGAPSWSWASIDGPIDPSPLFYPPGSFCAAIIHCDVTPARSDNPFGDIIDSSLVLKTKIKPAIWEEKDGFGKFLSVAWMSADDLKCTETWVSDYKAFVVGNWDDEDPSSERTRNVYLAIVHERSDHGIIAIDGLVLVPVINQITNTQRYDSPGYNVFRRVGKFVDCSERFWMPKEEDRCIKII